MINGTTPLLDERNADAIAEQFNNRRVGYLPNWTPREKSAGAALGRVYARLVETVLQR